MPHVGQAEHAINASVCVHPAADHLDAQASTSICGRRLPRPNPCWMEKGQGAEKGKVACLPAVFLLGEMRCGTTSLYARLTSHPDVEAPIFKESRYLTLPKYRHFTGSWYASNFAPVASKPNAVTLDASPTVFNAPLLAPSWIRKWVPSARHVVLLRDPVQRTYSHWRAGVAWLRESSCYVTPPVPANASAAHAAAFFKPQPIPEVRMMREVFSFHSQSRLGLIEVALRACGAASGWGRYGGDEMELSNETKACVLAQPIGHEVAALWKTRQALAARRTASERAAYAEGMRRVSSCSEFMLRPGAGVWRSSRYASNLAAWYLAFPRAQLKVPPRTFPNLPLAFYSPSIHLATATEELGTFHWPSIHLPLTSTPFPPQVIATEELETDPKAVMADVLAFLGLRALELPEPKEPKLCVVGKAADTDEVPAANAAWRASRLDGSSDEGGNGGATLGKCAERAPTEAARGKDGVSRYRLDSETEALLRRYFEPSNTKLFTLLGRRLPWGEAPTVEDP